MSEIDSEYRWLSRHGWILLLALPGLWALLVRPAAPLDETRALGVAWEMWLRGDFLVPYLNGEPYSHKPPLMQWLIHSGWSLFGVNEWWPRLVNPLVILGATGLAGRLATELWPAIAGAGQRTQWLLAGTLGWLFISQTVLYDPLQALCVMTAMLGLWRASSRGGVRPWLLLGMGIGLGILAKGPVMLLHVGVTALLAPLWSEAARRRPWAWYTSLLLTVAGGLAIALAWAVPAAQRGGTAYADAILLGQTAGRIAHSFAHARPWWAYLAYLPLLLLPWPALPSTWKALWKFRPADAGDRFVLVWLLGTLLAFSLISAKQPHYILPEIAAAMLLIGRCLPLTVDIGRVARFATVFTVAVLGIASAVLVVKGAEIDVRPAARLAAQLQQKGVPLASLHNYYQQLGFYGRLREPFDVIPYGEQQAWFERHPTGMIVTFDRPLNDVKAAKRYASFPYRNGTVDFWYVPEKRDTTPQNGTLPAEEVGGDEMRR